MLFTFLMLLQYNYDKYFGVITKKDVASGVDGEKEWDRGVLFVFTIP